MLILSSYCQLMKDIYDELAGRVRSDNRKVQESKRIPECVNGRLATPKAGSFLVQLIPENEDEKIVTLLYRCFDLYLDSYHYDGNFLLLFSTILICTFHSPLILDLGFIGVWYRLSDHEAELPSREQLHYLKNRSGSGIVKLPISSSYADLGGANIDVGHHAFTTCYYELRKTNILCLSAKGIKDLQSGPLATPAVAISEAVRFSFQQKLVKKSLSSGIDIHITSKYSTYFNLWGSFSKAMYTKEVPEDAGFP